MSTATPSHRPDQPISAQSADKIATPSETRAATCIAASGDGARSCIRTAEDPREHPLWRLAERAFDNREAYDLYYGLAYRSLLSWTPNSLDLPAALRWLSRHDLLIRAQLARRAERPGPEATGPLEAEVRLLHRHFAYRAQSLRNQPRTNQLLRLMVAGRNGEADERVSAERIRSWLDENGGFGPAQRQLVGAGGL